MNRQQIIWVMLAALMMPVMAHAQVSGKALQQDKPIEISSDKLDVLQNEHKAIFSGNVIAVQDSTKMRSNEMVVFYRDNATKGVQGASTPQGIHRIEAKGKVVFTTPTETALGDKAIYNVDTDTIDLVGASVTLTRGQNVLKGTKLNYNMATGRSILTGGAAGEEGIVNQGKPARVHGLFVPKSEPKDKP